MSSSVEKKKKKKKKRKRKRKKGLGKGVWGLVEAWKEGKFASKRKNKI
jgi:hypothetical protein